MRCECGETGDWVEVTASLVRREILLPTAIRLISHALKPLSELNRVLRSKNESSLHVAGNLSAFDLATWLSQVELSILNFSSYRMGNALVLDVQVGNDRGTVRCRASLRSGSWNRILIFSVLIYERYFLLLLFFSHADR